MVKNIKSIVFLSLEIHKQKTQDNTQGCRFTSLEFLKLKSSFSFTVTLTNIHDYSSQFPRFTEICFYKDVILHRSFHWSFVLFEFLLGWKVAQ